MRIKALLPAALIALAAPLLSAAPAQANTVTVAFSAASFHCLRGVYDVAGVNITGASQSAPYINGWWTGSASTAYVTVYAVPPQGGIGMVTLTYHCKTAWGWPSTPLAAQDTRWFYGSGSQPHYHL